MTRLVVIATLVGGAALCAVTASCKKAKTVTEPPIRPVRFEMVELTGGQSTRTFAGVIEAGEQTKLSFKVRGNLKSVPVKVGDKVKKGQLIAQLDKTDYELQLQQARASYSSANAQLRKASADYDRVQSLYESNNAARGDLDAARAGRDTARAQLSAASKATALSKQQLSYTKLTAPTDGAVASVLVEKNENIAPGSPVVVLTSGTRPKVTVAMPEILIGRVEAGSKVTVSVEALKGQTLEAVVSEVGVSAAGGGATFPVMAELLDGNDKVRPGMAADVRFEFGNADSPSKLVVPSHAVGEDRDGRFVFLLEKKEEGFGVVHRKKVVVKGLTSGGIEVTEGVKDGDLIVTAGVNRIRDGLRVRVP